MPFSRTTSLSRVLQARPALLELLEASGQPFWIHPDLSVETFCRQSGLDVEIWLKQAEDFPVPHAASDWSREPLYRVADYLIADHRQFREDDLRNINQLLEPRGIPVYSDGHVRKTACQAFKPFEERFIERMHEEETLLFPHILRLEACTRIHALKPLTHRVSVRVFAASQGHSSDQHLRRVLGEILGRMCGGGIEKPSARISVQLCDALKSLEKRLIAHAGIENNVLYPRAALLEKHFLEEQVHAHV
jgi:regulator of cell morphogenesis and NO signaling